MSKEPNISSKIVLVSGAAILLNIKLWMLCSFFAQSRQIEASQSKQYTLNGFSSMPDATSLHHCLKNKQLKLNAFNGKDLAKGVFNWASEASPTLGCSIEISHDICYIYICVSRGPKSVGGIMWAKRAHAQSQYIGR